MKGKIGEDIAVEYLKNIKQYTILARNYRYKKYEIDILCKKGDLFILVEVKYRSSIEFFNITRKQMKNFVNFIHEKLYNYETQIDVILVYEKKVTHFENISMHVI
jgi:putative endonuclease